MFLLRFWLFRTVAKLRLLFVCVCVFFFLSGPAHILCLTVASGWNKEQCTPAAIDIITSQNFL